MIVRLYVVATITRSSVRIRWLPTLSTRTEAVPPGATKIASSAPTADSLRRTASASYAANIRFGSTTAPGSIAISYVSRAVSCRSSLVAMPSTIVVSSANGTPSRVPSMATRTGRQSAS